MRLAVDTGAPSAQDSAHIPPVEALVAAFPGLKIEHLIGHGGMGVVYQARQVNLDRRVALKILSPSLSRDPAFAERFLREARALAKLSHPNIVTVFDFGQSEGFYFLTMEFVDGVNLRDTIAASSLTSSEALSIVPQICDALQYAHDAGVVHRDIKPENILIAKNGSIKIADFGLAKILDPTTEQFTLTGTRQVMGTRNYMAPEQIEHPDVVDHRADLYSLGVVFYELLTGELPLGRFSLPSEKSATVSSQLDDVVMRTLEKDPGRRFQQASQIKTACESCAVGSPESSRTSEASKAANQFNATTNSVELPSSVPICQSFPVTLGDVFGGLACGYGIMRGFETHLEMEYEIRDSVVDHKWGSHQIQIPLERIAWIRMHQGWFFTFVEVQANQIQWVSEIPSSKQGKFLAYLKKSDRESAEQLVNYVQAQIGRPLGINQPARPVKSKIDGGPVYRPNHTVPITIAMIFGFVIFTMIIISAAVWWKFSQLGPEPTNVRTIDSRVPSARDSNDSEAREEVVTLELETSESGQ